MASKGMTIEELVSKWTIDADLTPLENGRQALVGLSTSLGAIAASVGGAVAALFGVAKSTASAGEEAMKAAQKFGITTKAYQELMYAARGEAGDLSGGLLFLNRNIESAISGSKEAAKAFSSLGVSLQSGGKLRNSEEILMDLSDRFKAMPADARRTAAAVSIFGRSGANLLPFLVQGREEIAALRQEAVDFGFVIEDTAAADAFNDSMDDLFNIMRGFRNMIGVGLIPVINDLMQGFKEWLRTNRDLIVSGLKEFLASTLTYVKIMTGFLWNLYKAASALVRVFGGWQKVIKLVIAAMATYFALNAVYNLGRLVIATVQVVKGLYAVGMAWKAAGWQALIAQAKMLAIPLLIGAAVIGLLLILEDLWTFFSGGGESLTGDIWNAMKDVGKWILDGITSAATAAGDWMKKWAGTVADWIIAPFKPLIDLLTWIGNKGSAIAKGGAGSGIADSLRNALPAFLGGPTAAKPTLAGVAGTAPSYAGATGGGDISKQIQQASTINQTINIGEGKNAIATGKEVAGQTDNVLAKRNREAARTFSAQGEY